MTSSTLERDLQVATTALAFYANSDIYSSLAYGDGPGTLPLLAADGGEIARAAIAQIQREADHETKGPS